MFQAAIPDKKLTPNQINGQRGEHLVADRTLSMGFSFQGLNRLETGVDGFLELRDQTTHAMLAKWIGVQIKTRVDGKYTRESDADFEYLLDPSDLSYWSAASLPVIIVLTRLSDGTMYWKHVGDGGISEPRRLSFDKSADVFDATAADKIAALTVEKERMGSHVPPMIAGERAHLNMIRMIMPDEIFVARTAFKSQREATKEMLKQRGRPYFDWVIRDGSFWSFRDPRDGPMAEIIDVDTVEAVESEIVLLPDDTDDENVVIDLLRRSVESQLYNDLVFDKDSRALYFRADGPGMAKTYAYHSLQQKTSADVVMLIRKEGRDAIMRHHAFHPRYQRLGNEWFISIQPTFVFTSDGYRPHPASSLMLSGKKKLERNGALRGQFVMWRHLLIKSGAPTLKLFPEQDQDPRPTIKFEAVEPIILPVSVPEDVWKKEDPNAGNMVASEGFL